MKTADNHRLKEGNTYSLWTREGTPRAVTGVVRDRMLLTQEGRFNVCNLYWDGESILTESVKWENVATC